ncbi:antitoxin [Muribacter muris]|uniref:Antitoxin n=1 Tax=Muribacter muris TaxID=67855 RepID=A0A4Y9K247_9PAST|nr:type II toxin-antitoxin system VapB family antitoxin [Muribacter muris]MBF0784959.1 antitoxin [Muribacter muris]MBF0827267.1 antitoxin [Muribacter muris]TFV10877.1 antitoxin [Muribacter muris]
MEASVFITNRTQAVRLPATMRFDEHIKKVNIRIVGKDRILSPTEHSWDSFFLTEQNVSDDFLNERERSIQTEREEF